MKISNKLNGFTLIEILIVLGISLIIFSVTWVISSSSVASNESFSFTQRILSDFRSAQFRSMFDSQTSTSQAPFGIHLEANRYVIFRGTSYIEAAVDNIETPLPDNLEIRNNTLGSDIIFTLSSGEIGIDGSFALFNKATNTQTIIQINRLGIIQTN